MQSFFADPLTGRGLFNQLIAVHRKSLLVFSLFLVRKCGGGIEDAEDLVQDTCLEAFRLKDRFQGDSSSLFFPWLKTIATYKALNLSRTLKPNRQLVKSWEPEHVSELSSWERSAAVEDGVQDAVEHAEATESIRPALNSFKDDPARSLISLVYLERLSIRQVAGLIGRSSSAVHKRLSSSLTHFSAYLKAHPTYKEVLFP